MLEDVKTTTNSYFVNQEDTVNQQIDIVIKKVPNNDEQDHKYDDQKKLNDYKVKESRSASQEIIDNYNPGNLAEAVYNTMFTDNKYLSRVFEEQDIKGTSIEKMHALSQFFIKDIQEELGELNEEEIQIVKRFQELPPFRFIHQSEYDLKTQEVLQIFSRDRLKQNGINHNDLRTHPNDEETANNDFVFFSVEFTDYKITEPPLLSPHGGIYARNAYIIPENFSEFGYVTLTDHAVGAIRTFGRAYEVFDEIDKFIEVFKVANVIRLTEPKPMIKGGPIKHQIAIMRSTKLDASPVFSLEDIRLGMALYAIKRIRETDKMICSEINKVELLEQRKVFIKDILSKNPEFQNHVLNAIFNLEYHLPGMVVAQPGEYASHERNSLNLT